MESLHLWLLGLELTRFAPADDAADSVASSLATVESGGLQLSPYEGPAIQPYLLWQSEKLGIGLAPGAGLRREQATDGSGREAEVTALQWRVEARAWWGQRGIVGLDVAVSGGSARREGEVVAEAPLSLQLAPTAGLRAPLGERVAVVGRARVPVLVSGADLAAGLSGAASLEWEL